MRHGQTRPTSRTRQRAPKCRAARRTAAGIASVSLTPHPTRAAWNAGVLRPPTRAAAGTDSVPRRIGQRMLRRGPTGTVVGDRRSLSTRGQALTSATNNRCASIRQWCSSGQATDRSPAIRLPARVSRVIALRARPSNATALRETNLVARFAVAAPLAVATLLAAAAPGIRANPQRHRFSLGRSRR